MRHHVPQLVEYWSSYWNSKIDLRRQFGFFSAVHVSTMPFMFRLGLNGPPTSPFLPGNLVE